MSYLILNVSPSNNNQHLYCVMKKIELQNSLQYLSKYFSEHSEKKKKIHKTKAKNGTLNKEK